MITLYVVLGLVQCCHDVLCLYELCLYNVSYTNKNVILFNKPRYCTYKNTPTLFVRIQNRHACSSVPYPACNTTFKQYYT